MIYLQKYKQNSNGGFASILIPLYFVIISFFILLIAYSQSYQDSEVKKDDIIQVANYFTLGKPPETLHAIQSENINFSLARDKSTENLISLIAKFLPVEQIILNEANPYIEVRIYHKDFWVDNNISHNIKYFIDTLKLFLLANSNIKSEITIGINEKHLKRANIWDSNLLSKLNHLAEYSNIEKTNQINIGLDLSQDQQVVFRFR
jgi:hypothetical protein